MPSDDTHPCNQAQSDFPTSISAYGDSSQESHWFPMRIAYDKDAMKIGHELQEHGIEFFLPTEDVVEPHAEGHSINQRPKIADLIFLHATKTKITDLKHGSTLCRYLRFITYIPHAAQRTHMTPMQRSSANRIVIIPDDEMQQFIHTITLLKDEITLIPYSETFNHIGHKIRILQGPLAGTIGTLRRIKNNKHVHIDCGGLLTVELGYVPKEMYELLVTTE